MYSARSYDGMGQGCMECSGTGAPGQGSGGVSRYCLLIILGLCRDNGKENGNYHIVRYCLLIVIKRVYVL